MISREAIAYDLREARDHISGGQTQAARLQIAALMENLQLLLHAPGPATRFRENQLCGTDQFGRDDILMLEVFCGQAIKVMAHSNRERAELILDKAQRFWDGLPVKIPGKP